MPSIVDEYGIQMTPEGQIVLTDENIDRFVAMLCCKLRASGYTIRHLAAILNRSYSDIQRRIAEMPPEAVAYYVSFRVA